MPSIELEVRLEVLPLLGELRGGHVLRRTRENRSVTSTQVRRGEQPGREPVRARDRRGRPAPRSTCRSCRSRGSSDTCAPDGRGSRPAPDPVERRPGHVLGLAGVEPRERVRVAHQRTARAARARPRPTARSPPRSANACDRCRPRAGRPRARRELREPLGGVAHRHARARAPCSDTFASAFSLRTAAEHLGRDRVDLRVGALGDRQLVGGPARRARWIEPSRHHDQTSSVTYGRNGANSAQQHVERQPQRGDRAGRALGAVRAVGALLHELEVVVGEAPEEPLEQVERPRVLVVLERRGRLAHARRAAPRASRGRAAPSIAPGSTSKPSTNLEAFRILIARRRPTFICCSSNAASIPRRALAAQ